MIFRCKFVEASQLATSVQVAAAPIPTVDGGNIPLIHVLGHGFDRLRSVDLGHSLWRTNVATEDLDHLGSRQIVVVAANSPEDVESSRPLMQRFMTVVLAMGLGPHYGSRALALGAVGYVDASIGEGDFRGPFSDAVARVRIRHVREAGASLSGIDRETTCGTIPAHRRRTHSRRVPR